MELKEYQKKTLEQVKIYLEWLAKAEEEAIKRAKDSSSEFTEESFDFPQAAWRKASKRNYYPKRNGLHEDLQTSILKFLQAGAKLYLHVIQ